MPGGRSCPPRRRSSPDPVRPGDRMRAVIAKLNHGKWSISLRNLTQGWRFHTVQAYKGPQTSAEWIVEAPQVGSSISSLARLTPVVFSCCRVNGRNPRLKLSQRGIMIQNGKKGIHSFASEPGRRCFSR
ncbi:G1 family glutamic endopeptidase [Cohnella ginsengisoli]